jgi:hypothetical protein
MCQRKTTVPVTSRESLTLLAAGFGLFGVAGTAGNKRLHAAAMNLTCAETVDISKTEKLVQFAQFASVMLYLRGEKRTCNEENAWTWLRPRCRARQHSGEEVVGAG